MGFFSTALILLLKNGDDLCQLREVTDGSELVVGLSNVCIDYGLEWFKREQTV